MFYPLIQYFIYGGGSSADSAVPPIRQSAVWPPFLQFSANPPFFRRSAVPPNILFFALFKVNYFFNLT